MRRNMDLIRLLLLDMEGEEKIDLSEYTSEQILYHKYLLADSEFVYGDVLTGDNMIIDVAMSYITWKGHDFLDAARNETIWKKATTKVKETSGSVALEVIKALLIAYTKESLQLPP